MLFYHFIKCFCHFIKCCDLINCLRLTTHLFKLITETKKPPVLMFDRRMPGEAPECPLCLEELEADDLNFFPCSCGYQVDHSLSQSFDPNENLPRFVVSVGTAYGQ